MLRWPSWAFRPNEPYGFCGHKSNIEPCSRIGLSLSLICQLMSEDIKQHNSKKKKEKELSFLVWFRTASFRTVILDSHLLLLKWSDC